MSPTDFELDSLRKDITEHSLQIKAIIQDINDCEGPLSELHELNAAGRSKIAALREYIDKFLEVAEENNNSNLLKEVLLHREQLSSTMDYFKKANIKAMLKIEKDSKEKLFRRSDGSDLRRRQPKRDKENLVKLSSNLTDKLLAVSRQIAETTKQSDDTLNTLISSSENIYGTQEELKVTGSVITQSGKLLAKYGRREFTDKILVWFAFLFFCFCVFYVVQKRLF